MKMSIVVRTTTKLISPFLVTYAAYLMIYGHLSPGGGFQAGVILAVSVILLITSHGYKKVKKKFKFKEVGIIESFSAIFLVSLGLVGILFGGFFYNFLNERKFGSLISGGIVPLFNIAVGLKVGAAFTFLFYILLRWVESD
ncbi:cation:proton antiporter [Thermococcus sp. M39]|uniref:Na(+)/H(+) antiporter subunit B n=1 Tax=unclassified Thermococcus TaxID=2627626 RepID=UPI00143C04D4|nr:MULTISPECIES: Na(+)/H(+) antiporter subunit B [unclassified Thermococcus]NJE08533.1 cation:proton antiporter [Thermococcus sp. M39]NJE13131.1 cation:proton antiporter [Thermococcus sp. LS2]